ncbi:hypothetical protein CPB83DRAFT_849885 [Crepidotus variabilis]|uniref:Uncharacterized protein n=1 Tax=Crepidotus variabilis TaxID=179855 RepID=A0A9P6JSG7_9AGAR|nr:hypothetical protein CPB83DRAFT_849885 [Crepidotus variabilis]
MQYQHKVRLVELIRTSSDEGLAAVCCGGSSCTSDLTAQYQLLRATGLLLRLRRTFGKAGTSG